MKEEILAVASCVTGAEEHEAAYLTKLCAMEEARLQSRLKEPLTEQNRDAFICAAAWMAAADYFAGKGTDGTESWSAGDVTVHEKPSSAYSTTSESLRKAAQVLLEGHLEDRHFAFLGVDG